MSQRVGHLKGLMVLRRRGGGALLDLPNSKEGLLSKKVVLSRKFSKWLQVKTRLSSLRSLFLPLWGSLESFCRENSEGNGSSLDP